MHVLDRALARLSVYVLAAGELLLDDVDLRGVLEPLRPFPGSQADGAAQNFRQPLQHDQHARNRDDRLELIDGRSLGRHVRVLADEPGFPGVLRAGVDQAKNSWDEKSDVKDEIE